MLAASNPKAYAAFSALFAGTTVQPDRPLADMVATVGILSVAVVTITTGWLLAGCLLSAAFRHPRFGRVLNLGFAALLLASVFGAALHLRTLL